MTPEAQADHARELFLSGMDTVQIASRLHLAEWQAAKLVWIARCRAKGLPAKFYSNRTGGLTDANPDHARKSA